jgi:hypothetical protein
MGWHNVIKWVKSDYLKLILILGLAFYLAFIPHQSYPYPVHVDEWAHLSYANEIIKEGKAFGLSNPYNGGAPIIDQLGEVGFQTFLAVFHLTSDIDWLTIFKYLPSIIFMLTILAAYILGKRKGFGWEAALLTCLIPTTIGLLGPGLLVPVAMGLPFIVAAIFVAFYLRGWWSYVLLAIFSIFLISIHAATSIALFSILIPYIIISLKGDFKHSVGIVLVLAIPFGAALLMFPAIIDKLLIPTLKALFVQQPIPAHHIIPEIIATYGYIPVLLCLLGAYLLMIKKDKTNYGLVLGLLVLLLMYFIFQYYGYGISMMYLRGFQYICLMMSIVAGAGLMGIKEFQLPISFGYWVQSNVLVRNIGRILCVIVIGMMLYLAIPAQQQSYYYHMIDDTDYQSFIWIKNNLGSEYNKAVLDPWEGVPFTAITGKNVYAWIIVEPDNNDRSAYAFLSDGCKDTNFLKKNGISIVYTREACNNPNLVEVAKYIYVLKRQ